MYVMCIVSFACDLFIFKHLFVVHAGDEIHVAAADPTAISATNFTAYCKRMKISPAEGCGCGNVTITIDTAAGDKLSNGQYYHSMKFTHAAGIHRQMQTSAQTSRRRFT